ncbi:MAG: hypothetical protein KF773_12425 [Deltaproteobacteria bacterium]|nr:hypothetical protein [Deltaproteobacteria bacterium]
MIGVPFNDLGCLGSITQTIAGLVRDREPAIVEIADKHASTESLAAWIRTLPQRDDTGDPQDGPKVVECDPEQRLRIPAADPNCVERSALYLAAAELIEPGPVRQLATLDTAIGLHTFPLESGAPIVLDPRVPRNGLRYGVTMAALGPVVVDARDAIEWSAQLAEDGAGAAPLRNGPSRVRVARNAVMRLVDEGAVPASSEVDAMGWMFALAEQAARRYGARALTMVRTTARAIADVLDEVLARTQRNLTLNERDHRAETRRRIGQLVVAAGRVGLGIGGAALHAQLDALGIGKDLVPFVELELNREGLSLGSLARPPHLSAFGSRA